MRRKILILLIAGFALIIPLSQAKAFDPLIGAAVASAIAVVGGWLLQLISFATAGLVTASSAMLRWVLYDLPFTYTKLTTAEGTQTLVGVGWPIIRDLTNMLFIIILVFIGLAVALRLKDYEAKKILATLVAMALLINFTPVIVGLIVDASNIVMNFFLKDLNPGAYFERHLAIQKQIMPTGWELLNPFQNMQQTVAALLLIFADLIVFAVMLMFTLLFLTRYVAIWVLVILSPLAFASYILPATRKYWKQWWNQLFQWCIIGVIAGFFLYLGTHLFRAVGETMPYSSEGGMIVELATKMMPLIMIIIFYMIGLVTAFSTSAMGAKEITAGFKRGYKAAGKTAALSSWRGTTKTFKTGVAAAKEGFQAYKLRREPQGMLRAGTRKEAFGYAIESARAKVRTETGGIRGVSKGTLKAIGDVASAGLKTGFGIKMRKKGKRTRKGFMECPSCHKEISEKAKACTECGLSLE